MSHPVVQNILAVIPDACPQWINYLVQLHLQLDPIPFNAQLRVLDAAFRFGYVKAQDPKPDIPPPAPLPLPVELPVPAPHPPRPPAQAPPAQAPAPAPPAPAPPAQVPPLGSRAAEKRKAPDLAAEFPAGKRQAVGPHVDYTQTQRPPSHMRTFWYNDLSVKYLTAVFTNLPLHYIRQQFNQVGYLAPAYLAIQQKITSGILDSKALKKRRFCTGPYGKECEQSALFVAEKKALDSYIASGRKDISLLRRATPPLDENLARYRSPVVPASQSSARSSTPAAGPNQPSTSGASQASRASQPNPTSQAGPVRQRSPAVREATRSPSPFPRRLGSRSPSPIEIETQDSVIVIETQESQVEIIKSPSPAPVEEPAGVECGCCFAEMDISEMMQCVEGHLFCLECTRRNAETAVGGGKADVLCMDQSGCRAPFPEEQLQMVLSPKTLDLLNRIRQKRDLDEAKIGGLEHCPFCDFACIIEDDGRTFLCQKPECMAVSCRKCWRRDHHGKSCEEMAQQEKSGQDEHAVAEAMSRALIRDCPKCKTPFMKEEGCNKMQCPRCGAISCYICRKEVSKLAPYSHFDQQPDAYHLPPDRNKCPLWDIDRAGRVGGSPSRAHSEAVARAEKEARARIAAQAKIAAPRFN